MECVDLVEYVSKGSQNIKIYEFAGGFIKYRPLLSSEFDKIMQDVLIGAEEEPALVLLKNFFGIKLEKSYVIDKDMLIKARELNNRIDYLTVFYATKDFQSKDFSVSTLYKVPFDIHRLAEKIIAMSYQPQDKVAKFIATREGKRLATIHYRFHVPITSELWKLTPLQETFLALSNPNAPKIVKDIEDLGFMKGETEDIPDYVKEMLK